MRPKNAKSIPSHKFNTKTLNIPLFFVERGVLIEKENDTKEDK